MPKNTSCFHFLFPLPFPPVFGRIPILLRYASPPLYHTHPRVTEFNRHGSISPLFSFSSFFYFNLRFTLNLLLPASCAFRQHSSTSHYHSSSCMNDASKSIAVSRSHSVRPRIYYVASAMKVLGKIKRTFRGVFSQSEGYRKARRRSLSSRHPTRALKSKIT